MNTEDFICFLHGRLQNKEVLDSLGLEEDDPEELLKCLRFSFLEYLDYQEIEDACGIIGGTSLLNRVKFYILKCYDGKKT